MGEKKSRAEKAGILLGKALIEMVHLMYQDNTAKNFLTGLLNTLTKEWERRGLNGVHKRSKV